MIYLDNSASTRPDPAVLASYQAAADAYFANPASLHPEGTRAENLLEKARKQVAAQLRAEPFEVIFTSGATEANNTAIQGTAKNKTGRVHMVVTTVEHPSVHETCLHLESQGVDITWLHPDQDGRITVPQVESALKDHTCLVSMMHVNNETGVVFPIEEVGGMLQHYPNVAFHVDHVQGAGRVPLDFSEAGVDLLTISGHKIHGLKGTGALLVRKASLLKPLLHGGGQEAGLRSGTADAAGAVSLAKALRLTMEAAGDKQQHMRRLSLDIQQFLLERPDVFVLQPGESAPHITAAALTTRNPEPFIQAMAEQDVIISTTSACSSKAAGSRVWKGMGLDGSGAVRISLTSSTTEEDVEGFKQAWLQAEEKIIKAGAAL